MRLATTIKEDVGFDPEVSDPSLQWKAAEHKPALPNVNPEFAEKHPTLNRALEVVSYPARKVMETPWMERAGQTGAEIMTAVYNPEKASTGSMLGDTAADLWGSVMGFVGNPQSAGAKLWGGSERLVEMAMRKAPALSKIPAAAQTGIRMGATTVPFEAGMAAVNNRDMSAGEMATAAGANALLGALPYGAGKLLGGKAPKATLPEMRLRVPEMAAVKVEPLQPRPILPIANEKFSVLPGKTKAEQTNANILQRLESWNRKNLGMDKKAAQAEAKAQMDNILAGVKRQQENWIGEKFMPKAARQQELKDSLGLMRPSTPEQVAGIGRAMEPVNPRAGTMQGDSKGIFLRMPKPETPKATPQPKGDLLGEGSISAAKFTVPEKMAAAKPALPEMRLRVPEMGAVPTFDQWAKREYGDYSDFSKGMLETAKAKYDRHIKELAEVAKYEVKDIPSEFEKMYYRGEKTGETKKISTGVDSWDNNLFVANNPKSVLSYGDKVERIALKKNSRVLVEGSKEYKKLVGNKKHQRPLDEYVAVLEKAKGQGYDAVEFKNQTDVGTVILNENSVVRNYSPMSAPQPKGNLTREGSISAAKFTVPEKMAEVGDGTKVRSLGVSAMNNPEIHPDVKAGLLMETYEGGAGTYKAITNKETIAQAQKMIADDINGALRHAKQNPGTALSNTIELEMVKKANAENRFDDAIDIINEVSQRSTTQGQAIQSLRLWGKMSPEGMQKYYVNTINKVNKDIEKQMGKNAKKLITDPKLMEDIKIRMDNIGKMAEGRERDIETAKVLDKIAAQVPAPFLRKVATVHTMAQLLNPKTAIRNIVGNVGFMGMENVSGILGAAIDRPLSLLTGKRTKVLPDLGAQAKGFKQGWKHGLEDALLGIDTSAMATKFDLPQGRVFRKGFMGKAETAMNIELRATDRAFYRAAYEDSLSNQMRAAKTNTPTEEMMNTAHLDGLYRTFQDENALTAVFVGLKKLMNDPAHTVKFAKDRPAREFGMGDFIVKYPRTPANLLSRGLAYSPAGFTKSLIEMARPLVGKKFDQRAFVDSFSRATVGSAALFGTGALLHKLGIITGKRHDDYDLAELQNQQGFGEYRINASALKRLVFGGGDTKPQKGDKIISYDWFQPQAIPLAIGADIDANKGTEKGLVGPLLSALVTGINAFAEQPVVQGIETLFSGGYGDYSKGVVKVLENVPSSFIPTLLSQVRQLVDNQRRDTYDPMKGKESINRVKAKIPGLAATLPEKYGTLGQPLGTYPSGNNTPFNVFLNPAFVNTYNPSPEVQRVQDIYDLTGATNQVPRIADKSITVSGKKFTLSGQEYSNYQRLLGEYTQQEFAKMRKDLKPEDAAKKMQDIMTDANTKAKKEILEARGVRVIKKGNGLAIK